MEGGLEIFTYVSFLSTAVIIMKIKITIVLKIY